MNTEIYVEGKRVDLSKSIDNLLTFAIDDVKDFASRQTTFSKTIVLPGTANNNAIFGNIFEVGISNDYDPLLKNIGYNFNASKSAVCYMFQDNLQTFKGTIRMMEIVKDKGRIEYEMAMNGELTSLSVSLSSGFLTDLDFSEYNLDWTIANIANSWDNPGGSGVYFPLIDYGTYSTDKHDWDFRTLRPALYVKEYIDKMFAAAKFRYIAPLFDTDRFKKLIVPHNQKRLVSVTSSVMNGANTNLQHIIDHFLGPNGDSVNFGTVTGGLFTASMGKYYKYIGADPISTTIKIHVEGYYNLSSEDAFPFQIKIGLQKNGVDYFVDPDRLNINSGVNEGYIKDYDIPITLVQNDVFNFYFLLELGEVGTGNLWVTNARISLSTSAAVTAPIDYSEKIDMKFVIPQNVRQVDFLVSIVKLFNLYVYESKWDERLILMAPFPDFYDGTTVDWTYKLDRDQPIRIKPMSELTSKIYNFNYASDSDYYNDLYKKRYNIGYGNHIFDSSFEFASQESKLDIIFASTPIVGYLGEKKVYPTIFKRTGPDNAPVEENVDSVIRIMQTKKKSAVPAWIIKNGFGHLGEYTEYGYAGHFDDPDNPDNDLNFGVLQETFFELNAGDLAKTQFNLYWSGYMYEITSKDSKLLSGKFYLTAKDIFNLNFQNYVFIDGVLFRLNKITDYNASTPSTCQVELIKVINNSFGFPPGQIPPDLPNNWLLWTNGRAMLHVDEDGNELLYN